MTPTVRKTLVALTFAAGTAAVDDVDRVRLRAVHDSNDPDGVAGLHVVDPVVARVDQGVVVDRVGPGEAVLALDLDGRAADRRDITGLDRELLVAPVGRGDGEL